jgi:hypothetical protein
VLGRDHMLGPQPHRFHRHAQLLRKLHHHEGLAGGIGGDVAHQADLDAIETFLRSGKVKTRTSYVQTLDRWAHHYGRERLFVGFLDDIKSHPVKVLSRIYDHLGLGGHVPHDVTRRKVISKAAEFIPTVVARLIADTYMEEINAVAERVGGHALTWQAIAQRLVHDPPRGTHIAHPLNPDALGLKAWRPRAVHSRALSTPI